MKKLLHKYRWLRIVLAVIVGLVGLFLAFVLFLFLWLAFNFEPMPTFNPTPPLSHTLFGKIKQVAVNDGDVATWSTYDDPAGIHFRYPATAATFTNSGSTLYGLERFNYRSVHFLNSAGGEFGYSPCITGYTEQGGVRHSDHTAPDSFSSSACDSKSDRMVLRVEFHPFTRMNVTTLGTWFGKSIRDPERVTVDGVTGYHMVFRDGFCDYDHYAFPSKDGSQVVKLSFDTCKHSQQFIVPYRDAILKSVTFDKAGA